MESHWKIILCFGLLASGCSAMNRYNDYMAEPVCNNARSACDQADKYLADHRGRRDDNYRSLQITCDESLRSCQEVLRDNERLRRN